VLRSGQVTWLDFHREAPGGPIRLAVLVPVLGERVGRPPLGVLVMRIDPAAYLYPSIQRWPVPSPTSEVLIVRRDGNDALYLNALRFRQDAALTLRLPLTRIDVPAVRAVLGWEGVLEGPDYRGVPVVAAVRTVPGSPWFVVAKTDVSEAYAPLRQRLWAMVLLVGAVVAGAGAAIGWLWRQRSARFYRERYEAQLGRQHAEDALRESERAFRETLRHLDEGYYSVTPDGLVLDHNLAFNRILGFDVALDMRGRHTPDFWLNPEDRQAYLNELMTTGILRNYLANVKTASGEKVVVLINSHLEKDEQGGLVRIVGTFTDFTERKRAEEALRIKNQVFEDSIASQSVADKNGVITLVNRAFLRMWGYASKEEAVGKSVGSFFADPADATPVLEALAAHDAWEGRFAARRIDGSTFSSHGYATSLRGPTGELIGYQSTNLDVTPVVEAERQVKAANEDLERSNKELEQFAYVASHDLQEPLRMVSSYTQLLGQRYEGQLDEKAKKYIDYAVDGAVRMQRLINDLLTYSRVGTRGKPLEPTDAHAVLGEAVVNLAATIEESGALITNDDLPTVRTDASQLVQVFQNLLANAIKFRGAEPPRIHVSATDQGREWVFSVRDNGIGIERQYAARVFVIFQRLHTRQEYPGTGIGLALCKRIVERHGGHIWFESEPGAGSTFFFTVPK